MTTDPYSQYSSPYLGMGNNPMLLIDPDGAWHKDADGNLVSDTGDTVKSLATYKGISSVESNKIFTDQGFIENYNTDVGGIAGGQDFHDLSTKSNKGFFATYFGFGSGYSASSDFKGSKNVIDYSNNRSSYTYTSKDLRIRNSLMNSRVLSKAILSMESAGVFAPMGVDDWLDHYGADYYNSFRFFSGFEIAFPLAGGSDIIGIKGRASFSPKFKSVNPQPVILKTGPHKGFEFNSPKPFKLKYLP